MCAKQKNNFMQAGMAYVALLFMLVIVLALGLTFLLRAASEVSASANLKEGVQGEYLAESAVNHAVWRLLYDTNLPTVTEAEADDLYYMVNFNGLRYGYNFIPNTDTTFARIRGVGVTPNTVVTRAYVANLAAIPFEGIVAVYGRNNTDFARNRNFADPTWSNPVDAINVGGKIRRVRLAGSKLKTEAVMVTQDSQNDVNLAVYNGGAWGNLFEWSTNVDANHTSMAVAYESISGDAIAAGRYVNGRNPYYAVWNGTSWSAPTLITNAYGSGDIRHTVLAANPKSDEMIFAFLTSASAICGFRWTGSAWDNNGLITASASHASGWVLDAAYESQSGHGLVCYGEGNNALRYLEWTGAAAIGTAATVQKKVRVVRMASHVESDAIAIACLDEDKDLTVAIWNGSSIIRSVEEDVNLASNANRILAVAWEEQGDEALIFFARASTAGVLYYKRWNHATQTMSGLLTGPTIGGTIESIDALTIPGTDRIIVLAGNSQDDLKYVLWGGDSWEVSTPEVLDDNLFATPMQGFALTSLLQ